MRALLVVLLEINDASLSILVIMVAILGSGCTVDVVLSAVSVHTMHRSWEVLYS